jgi:hypothetical protein
LFDERDESEIICQLRDDWAQCRVNVGDYVNLIGKSESGDGSSMYFFFHVSGFTDGRFFGDE